MYRFLFTASGLNPFYCENMMEAREYMQEYALRGHKDCKVWSLTDFLNCQDSFQDFPSNEERTPDFVRAMQSEYRKASTAWEKMMEAQQKLHDNPPVVFRDTEEQLREVFSQGPLGQKYGTTPVPDPSTLPQNEGRKYDGGKLRYSLIPLDALEEVVKVLEFGAKKYGAHNWRMVENAYTRYWDASARHIFATQNGKPRDPETNLLHEAHAICCLLFRAQLQIESEGNEPTQNAHGDYE